MSILKTVIVTTAVLALGVVLTVGSYVVYLQQQDIDALTAQVIVLTDQAADSMKQASTTDKRLDDTIKSANRNFKTLKKGEDDLTEIMGLLIKLLKADSSDSSYIQSRNGL
jgi:uncharacterized protein HemX